MGKMISFYWSLLIVDYLVIGSLMCDTQASHHKDKLSVGSRDTRKSHLGSGQC